MRNQRVASSLRSRKTKMKKQFVLTDKFYISMYMRCMVNHIWKSENYCSVSSIKVCIDPVLDFFNNSINNHAFLYFIMHKYNEDSLLRCKDKRRFVRRKRPHIRSEAVEASQKQSSHSPGSQCIFGTSKLRTNFKQRLYAAKSASSSETGIGAQASSPSISCMQPSTPHLISIISPSENEKHWKRRLKYQDKIRHICCRSRRQDVQRSIRPTGPFIRCAKWWITRLVHSHFELGSTVGFMFPLRKSVKSKYNKSKFAQFSEAAFLCPCLNIHMNFIHVRKSAVNISTTVTYYMPAR